MAEPYSEVASEGERSSDVARAVWGVLLIWAGAVVFLRWGWGVGFLGAGAILLGAQAVRRYLRLKVDGFGLVAGGLLALCGVVSLFQVAIDLVPLLIIAVGVVLLVSTFTARPRHGAGGRPDSPAAAHPRP